MTELGWVFWVLISLLITESWGRALISTLGTAPNPVTGREPGSNA
jgi:hypothetical protein